MALSVADEFNDFTVVREADFTEGCDFSLVEVFYVHDVSSFHVVEALAFVVAVSVSAEDTA